MSDITESELIQAIQDATKQQPYDDGGLTFREIQEMTGIPPYKLHNILRDLKAEKKVVVYRAPRPNILGEMWSNVCYRMVTHPRLQ